MKILSSGSLLLSALILSGSFLLSSCTVDQESALFSKPAAAGSSSVEKKTTVKTDSAPSWAERMAAAKKKRDAERAEAAEKREKELAAKEKAKEAAEKKLAAEKKIQEAKDKALALKKAKEKEAEEKKKAEALALRKKEEKAERAAKLAAREKAKAEREARRNSESNEVAAVAQRSRGGGLFSMLSVSTPNKYKSEGHYIYVNQRLLDSLNSSNAKIEIDISEQRARVFKTGAAGSQLVIETSVSTGKPGHSTSPGTFRIKEKMVAKRSTLYGRWVNSSGSTVQSSGDSRRRPSGGSRFIGAEMPYWMRINGGIGMHIGYVPNYPASHGCIRVPPVIQPLIFSKVGVGTSVTIKR